MSRSVVLNRKFKDQFRKMTRRVSKFKIFEGNLRIIVSQFEKDVKININGKIEFLSDSWDATKNISTIN